MYNFILRSLTFFLNSCFKSRNTGWARDIWSKANNCSTLHFCQFQLIDSSFCSVDKYFLEFTYPTACRCMKWDYSRLSRWSYYTGTWKVVEVLWWPNGLLRLITRLKRPQQGTSSSILWRYHWLYKQQKPTWSWEACQNPWEHPKNLQAENGW